MVITTNLKLADTSLRDGDLREVRESIDQAEAASTQAADLNRQMMTFAGRGRVDMQRVTLDEVAKEMVALVRSVFPKDVTLRFEPGGEVPTVVADPSQVRQIMLNLLTNASDAMGDGPGAVVVRTGRTELDDHPSAFFVSDDVEPGVYGWIEVEDQGCGMSREVLGRVFDPFFTTKPEGRGLGLAAVLGIVRRHGGCIDVATGEGGPTQIRVLLPTA
jgi:signal transduction histidine kinase